MNQHTVHQESNKCWLENMICVCGIVVWNINSCVKRWRRESVCTTWSIISRVWIGTFRYNSFHKLTTIERTLIEDEHDNTNFIVECLTTAFPNTIYNTT
jgi:hypothetical protein